ncbi:caspase family protein [Microbulbifer sp. M83]|uniref:caspase family protein n=1 Tax=Microbulbifer sp. M83 TaxID=3118246 RepID=UPI002FE0E61E
MIKDCSRNGGLKAFLFLSATLVASLCSAYDEALPRYALVIGNSDYAFAPLRNPVNDARDMAKKLRKLRYRTTLATDMNPQQLRATVAEFYRSVSGDNAVTVFYYAGHGVQLQNSNYLVPVGVSIDDPMQLVANAYSINELLREVEQSGSSQNIVILDACRNNPFRKTRAVESQLRQIQAGLAMVEAPPSTLIAYATEPGNVAEDGRGRNGTYTRALLRHITRAETAEELFKRVRRDVLRATDNRQTPWEHSSLLETFYFAPPRNKKIPNVVSF